MTTPFERTRALHQARELLQELLLLQPGAEFNAIIRNAIQTVLRHFPDDAELQALADVVHRHCPRPMLAPMSNDGKLDSAPPH